MENKLSKSSGQKIFDWPFINSLKTIEEIELELKRIELKERGALREFRAFYSMAIFIVTVSWTLAVIAIVVLKGMGLLILDKAELITLISTTTINVFAFFVLVVKYMFNSPRS